MPRLTDSTGVCLAEVMVAMAAGAIVVSTAFQALNYFGSKLSTQQETISQHQDQRLGLRVLEDELRLAGTGSPKDAPAILAIGSREVEFTANLDGLTTVLTEPVTSLQQDLHVLNGSNWSQGKHIIVCSPDHCAEGRLAVNGRRTLLNLAAPIGSAFPAGSEVFVSNHIRYYANPTSGGRQSLMREVDGGANTIVGTVARFQLSYLNKQGAPTSDAGSVSRVRIELAVGRDLQGVISEIGLRGR